MASEKQQPASAPEQQSPSPDQKKTVEQVITEMVKREPEKVDVTKETLRNFKKNYDKKHLKIELDTHSEIEELKTKIADDVEGKFETNDTDLSMYFDSLARKEKGEDAIASLPGVEDAMKDKLKDVETMGDLRTLSVETLIALEDQYEGILLYVFTDLVEDKEKVDFKRFKTYEKPKPSTLLQVDFHGNDDANARLGAGDILPASVRCITVYEDGDRNRARTSTRRIGLKSKNEENSGFFDAEGYIPIYTGDVICIGGATDSQEGVDMEFEKKFRIKEGRKTKGLDYDAYEKSEDAQKDAEFLQTLAPSAQRNKIMTPEEMDALLSRIETSGTGRKVVEAVMAAQNENVTGAHCWDWVHKVYQRAGVSPRRIYQDLNYIGKDCGTHHASDELMSKIHPGDWLYINNKNQYDTHGNHSVIFLGWTDKSAGLARVASCGGAGQIGRIESQPRNLKEQAITHISKPV